MREKMHDIPRSLLKPCRASNVEKAMTKAELESMNLELITLLTAVRDQIDDTLEAFGADDDDVVELDDED